MNSKAVLLSIKPQHCRRIASGKKTVEIRKTQPILGAPFKVYMYQTLPKYGDLNERDGRVIGEFICDEIYSYGEDTPYGKYYMSESELADCCISSAELEKYADGKDLYGWHISDLKIYDKPKELSKFKKYNRTEENSPCAHTKWLYEPCETCKECNLTRPPQNWCYVEEIAMRGAEK